MSYASRPAILALIVVPVLVACGRRDDAADVDAGDVEVDAGETDAGDIDAAAIDGPTIDAIDVDVLITGPATPFDVAYANAWTFRGVTGAMSQSIAVVINPTTGTEPLDLTGFQVVSVVDDHPQAVFQFRIEVPAAAAVPVGNAAGSLSPAADTHVTPMVHEPRTDTDAPSLTMEWGNLTMAVNATVNVTAVLRNGSQQVTLPFVLTLSTSGIGVAITGANRVVSVSLI
ncbi:MAG TPA: hypothetical protein VM261_27635 [Kofleriaceae bacterium]|nr:hypothetical protein [Kofleriaceae bacterium]